MSGFLAWWSLARSTSANFWSFSASPPTFTAFTRVQHGPARAGMASAASGKPAKMTVTKV